MGFRQDLRTRLRAIQLTITGLEDAELNVPPAIHAGQCPLFVNFLGRTTYTSVSGGGSISRGDLDVTMRLYLGVYNSISEMEDLADTFEPLVESAFLGNSQLSLSNAPLAQINNARLLSNSGLTVQNYAVGNSDSENFAVIEFPLVISIDKYTGDC